MLKYSLIYLDSVDSTNTYALSLINKQEPSEGTIIYTYNQRQGKGMQGNKWQSEAGSNLLFSVILYPVFLASKNLFSLNQVIALAVCRCLEQLTMQRFKIKWPNDIMHEDDKVCGILVENTFRGMQLGACVAGIGINVNQLLFDAFSPKAVSLKNITGKHYNCEEVLQYFQTSFDYLYTLLINQKTSTLNEMYHQYLFRKDAMHVFERNGTYFNAVIKGVNDAGKLLIQQSDNVLEIIDVKEIKYIFN